MCKFVQKRLPPKFFLIVVRVKIFGEYNVSRQTWNDHVVDHSECCVQTKRSKLKHRTMPKISQRNRKPVLFVYDDLHARARFQSTMKRFLWFFWCSFLSLLFLHSPLALSLFCAAVEVTSKVSFVDTIQIFNILPLLLFSLLLAIWLHFWFHFAFLKVSSCDFVVLLGIVVTFGNAGISTRTKSEECSINNFLVILKFMKVTTAWATR
jgi:hypothetical protein